MIPGEYRLKKDDIEINKGRETLTINVSNTGDRPVQVGSHYHFPEVNRNLAFDRENAIGMRLNIAAGTAVRFEPGEEKEVELVAIAGNQHVYGLNNLTNGSVKDKQAIQARIKSEGFKGVGDQA
ncbi:urease subunit beta [Aquibacillus koreensis]|uniref:Urease subunit beta n=1 Tax=Aquibacillus koreensis TaxID=279446 RepID=A0A9X4ALL1_9BACI|nr:urease subunit beta [Aquibacillus koreensis]MCT2534168.1 urease subunit beta [Aquibacillus koreensis]MDC3422560.1 urease subunit beta [Aquibacillus koreensis]